VLKEGKGLGTCGDGSKKLKPPRMNLSAKIQGKKKTISKIRGGKKKNPHCQKKQKRNGAYESPRISSHKKNERKTINREK